MVSGNSRWKYYLLYYHISLKREATRPHCEKKVDKGLNHPLHLHIKSDHCKKYLWLSTLQNCKLIMKTRENKWRGRTSKNYWKITQWWGVGRTVGEKKEKENSPKAIQLPASAQGGLRDTVPDWTAPALEGMALPFPPHCWNCWGKGGNPFLLLFLFLSLFTFFFFLVKIQGFLMWRIGRTFEKQEPLRESTLGTDC